MSVLNIDIENVQEPQPVPDGEYTVQIVGTPEVRQSQRTGSPYLNVRLNVIEEAGAADVYDTIMLPEEKLDAADNERRKLRLKRFCDAFGISYEGGNIDLESAEGLQASALIALENDTEFGDRNRIKRYVPIR